MPRKRVRSGIEKTSLTPSSAIPQLQPVGLAVGQQRDLLDEHRAGAAPTRAARPGRAAPASVDRVVGRRRTATTRSPHSVVRHAEHLDRAHVGVPRQIGCGDRRRRHLHPAADDHVVGPTGHPQPAVVVETAEVVGAEPAVLQHRPRSAPGRPRSRRRASARAAAPRRPRRSGPRRRRAVGRRTRSRRRSRSSRRSARSRMPRASASARTSGCERTAADQDRVEARSASSASSTSSASSRISWVGTSEMYARPGGTARRPDPRTTGSVPATTDR